MMIRWAAAVSAVVGVACSAAVLAQAPAAEQGGRGRAGGARQAPPTLVMKVEWQRVPGVVGKRPGVPHQVPVEQRNVVDQNIELQYYGAAARQLLMAANDASSVWSGECEGPFAITLRPKDGYLDLTGQARIRWTTKTSGFHAVRPVLKLADGTLLVGDHESTSLPLLATTEFAVAGVRWVRLDPERVVTLNSPGNSNGEIWAKNPDLSKVEEVGFADLMPASGHGAGGYIHVGTIEVYGQKVPRPANTSASR